MPTRKRDYQAEYARRKSRAVDEGFSGYSQKRKIIRYYDRVLRGFYDDIEDADAGWWDEFRTWYDRTGG